MDRNELVPERPGGAPRHPARGALLDAGTQPQSGLTEAQAIREYPELAHLVTLRESGWQFLPLQMDDGCPVQLDGYRPYRAVTDAIRIRDSTDVLALRITNDRAPTVLWEYSGSLPDAVAELLALPDPETPEPRRLVNRARMAPLWIP